MRLIRPIKIQAVGVYSSSVPCDLKNACDSLSPTTSHNWSRVGYSTWVGNRDELKCLCFLTGRGLSPARAVPVQVVPGLSGGAVRLRLGGPGLSAGAVRLEVEGPEGPGLSASVVRLEMERPEEPELSAGAVRLEVEGQEGPELSLGAVCLRLGGPILAGLWKFEKNWYHFVFVSNVTKNAMWNNK